MFFICVFASMSFHLFKMGSFPAIKRTILLGRYTTHFFGCCKSAKNKFHSLARKPASFSPFANDVPPSCQKMDLQQLLSTHFRILGSKQRTGGLGGGLLSTGFLWFNFANLHDIDRLKISPVQFQSPLQI